MSNKISRRDFNKFLVVSGTFCGLNFYASHVNAWTGTRMRRSAVAPSGKAIFGYGYTTVDVSMTNNE